MSASIAGWFRVAIVAVLWGVALPVLAQDGQHNVADRQEMQRQLLQEELRLRQQQSQEVQGLQLKPDDRQEVQRFELQQQQRQRQLHQEQMDRRIQLEQTLHFDADPQRQMRLQAQQQEFQREREAQQIRFEQELRQWQLDRGLAAPK